MDVDNPFKEGTFSELRFDIIFQKSEYEKVKVWETSEIGPLSQNKIT